MSMPVLDAIKVSHIFPSWRPLLFNTMNRIPLDQILIGDRVRNTDPTAVADLVESIRNEGLIHPVTINKANRLIAGGHRVAAYKILAETSDEYKEIPFVYFEETNKLSHQISDLKLRRLELEENIRRKSMTWQEEAIGIAEYHQLASFQRDPASGPWLQTNTAKIMGVSQGYISNILRVAKALKADKASPLWSAASISEAICILLSNKKAESAKRFADIRLANRPKVNKNQMEFSEKPKTEKTTSIETLRSYFHVGNALDLLKQFAGKFDHIITDPPYAIEMDMFMNEQSIANVVEEHKVDENLVLLKEFLSVSREAAKETSYMCMWYDLTWHSFLVEESEKAGWIPCRWPFTWCKEHPCLNRAGNVNITKATEHCLFLRASSKAILAKPVSKNFVLCGRTKDNVCLEHPFAKPAQVWNPLIEAVSIPGQIILDPFAGSGSSLKAFWDSMRIPLGFEVKEEHITHGVNWWYEQVR